MIFRFEWHLYFWIYNSGCSNSDKFRKNVRCLPTYKSLRYVVVPYPHIGHIISHINAAKWPSCCRRCFEDPWDILLGVRDLWWSYHIGLCHSGSTRLQIKYCMYQTKTFYMESDVDVLNINHVSHESNDIKFIIKIQRNSNARISINPTISLQI